MGAHVRDDDQRCVSRKHGLQDSTAYGVAGDRLPCSSRVSANGSVDYEFPLGRLTGSADRRGILGGGIGSLNPKAFEIIQPRTVGISMSRTFQ